MSSSPSLTPCSGTLWLLLCIFSCNNKGTDEQHAVEDSDVSICRSYMQDVDLSCRESF